MEKRCGCAGPSRSPRRLSVLTSSAAALSLVVAAVCASPRIEVAAPTRCEPSCFLGTIRPSKPGLRGDVIALFAQLTVRVVSGRHAEDANTDFSVHVDKLAFCDVAAAGAKHYVAADGGPTPQDFSRPQPREVAEGQ